MKNFTEKEIKTHDRLFEKACKLIEDDLYIDEKTLYNVVNPSSEKRLKRALKLLNKVLF